MRKEPFLIGKYYHIYNRGTDKRIIFSDVFDLQRFIQSMEEFNVVDPTGGIYNNKFKNREKFRISSPKLVDFVCYCLNPNHYHFILSPLVDNGIEKFMQKLGAGYTKYFNEKYQRSGVLFQGRYKSIYISSDKYLMYLSAYINLNDHIHRLRPWRSKSMDKGVKLFWKSSWGEYLGKKKENFCNKSIILDRYKDVNDYKNFANSVVKGVLAKRYKNDLVFDDRLFIEKLK